MMNLAATYGSAPSPYDLWLVHLNEERRRKRNGRLYVSDLGKCPRQVAYWLLDTPARKEEPLARWNSLRKMRGGVLYEDELRKALEWSGQLVEYHHHFDLRDNWGGELDFIVKDYPVPGIPERVLEQKTEFNKAYLFRVKAPSPDHVYQTTTYDDALGGLPAPPIVHYERMPDTKYAKGSGANLWCDHVIDPKPDVTPLMDELDAMRASLPELPDILPRGLKRTDRGKNIRLVPDWRCGYCYFRKEEMGDGGVCKCNRSTETWVEGTTIKPKADIDKLAEWAEEQADAALRALL